LGQAGSDEHIVWTNSGGYEKFFSYRTIRAGVAAPLPKAANPLAVTYEFQGKSATLQDYLDRRRVTSLLILKDGIVQREKEFLAGGGKLIFPLPEIEIVGD
jgi:hypothetical protein